MKCIALDLASQTGYAHGDETIWGSGSMDFKVNKKFSGYSFHKFSVWLDDLIRYYIDIDHAIAIVYERPSSRPHWYTLRIHHGLAGIVQSFEGKYLGKVSVDNVPPASIKKHFTGKGNASKELMLETALKLYPKCTDDNEADALALFKYSKEVLYA